MLLSACQSGLLLDRGRAMARGPIEEVVRSYEERMAGEVNVAAESAPRPRVSAGELVIDQVQLLGRDGRSTQALETGVAGAIRMRVTATRQFERVNAVIVVRASAAEGAPVLLLDAMRDAEALSFEPGVSEVTFAMPSVGLAPGGYRAKLHLERSPLDLIDVIESFPFQVTSSKPFGSGEFFQSGRWRYSSVTARDS
jgi:hypothetical protein